MLTLHPSYIGSKGRTPDYVTLPYKEFLKIQEALEDAEDLAILSKARKASKGQKRYTLAETKKRLSL